MNIFNNTEISLTIPDRIRVLFGKKIKLVTVIDTTLETGVESTEQTITVDKFRKQNEFQYGEALEYTGPEKVEAFFVSEHESAGGLYVIEINATKDQIKRK